MKIVKATFLLGVILIVSRIEQWISISWYIVMLPWIGLTFTSLYFICEDIWRSYEEAKEN